MGLGCWGGLDVLQRYFLVFRYRVSLLMVASNQFFFLYSGSMTIDCLGILNDLSDCEDKLFPIGYQ